MADILVEKVLWWLGHVHRINEECLLRQLLYSQLFEGKRNHGRPLLQFKDVVKRNIKWREINTKIWQEAAKNKVGVESCHQAQAQNSHCQLDRL